MQKCIEFGSELSHGNSLVIRSIGHYLCNLGPVANSRGSARYEQESGHRGPRDLTDQEGQLPGQRTKQGKGPVQAGIWGGGGQGRKDVLSQRGCWQRELCGAWVQVGPVRPNVPAHGGWKRWVSPIINCPEYQLPVDGTVLPQGGNRGASLSREAQGSCWLDGSEWGRTPVGTP